MSIASRITSMENNIRNAYHGLDSIGIDTTNTNKNIENISALLEDFYDSLPKVSGSGTNISLSPTKIGRITSQINGDTQQNGTPTPDSPVEVQTVTGEQNVSVEGKNLINMVETNKSVNSQGNISSSNIIYLGVEDYIPVQPNTTYTITFQHDIVVDGGIANLYIGKKDKDGNFIERTSYYTNRTFTTDANTYYIFPYLNKSGFEFTTIGGYVQLEYGSTATEYEPYQGKDYEINLNNIELCKIGDYKDYIKKSKGQQLFDKSTITIGYINADGSITTNQSYATSDFIEIDSSLTYSKTVTNSPRVKLYDKDKNLISTESISDISSFGNAGTYTIPYENAKYIRFTTRVDQEPSSIDKVMFVVGDTIPTEYEPYLPKGTWYIEKNIGKVVLNGSENFGKSTSTSADIFSYNLNNGDTNGTTETKSNYFEYANTNVVGSCRKYNAYIYLIPTTYGNLTIEQFKTWLSTHNTTVYYVLATPTYEEITNETLITQLGNWYYAMSKNGQTNISVDGSLPAILDVSALKGES